LDTPLKVTEPQSYPTQELVEDELMKARKEAFEESQKLGSDIDDEDHGMCNQAFSFFCRRLSTAL